MITIHSHYINNSNNNVIENYFYSLSKQILEFEKTDLLFIQEDLLLNFNFGEKLKFNKNLSKRGKCPCGNNTYCGFCDI